MTNTKETPPEGATHNDVANFLWQQHIERNAIVKHLNMFVNGGAEIIEDNIIRKQLRNYGFVYVVYHDPPGHYELQFKYCDSSDNMDRMQSIWTFAETQEEAFKFVAKVNGILSDKEVLSRETEDVINA